MKTTRKTKKPAKQKLGPRQLKWLRKLESGKIKQAQGALYNGTGFCCLGVACVVVGMQPRKGRGDDYYFGSATSLLPSNAQKLLAFHYDDGAPEFEKLCLYDKRRPDSGSSLADRNDNGWSFKRIAAFVRRNPAAVFTKPK